MSEIRAPVAGMIWSVPVKIGERIKQGSALVILECMKVEIPIKSEVSGMVRSIQVTEGDSVEEGDIMLIVEQES